MEVKWSSEAKKEFLELESEVQKEIRDWKDKLPEKGTGWEKVSPLIRPELDLEAFRLKINPEERENVNHRIIFDVEDNCFVIYKVGERTDFYESDNLEETAGRM